MNMRAEPMEVDLDIFRWQSGLLHMWKYVRYDLISASLSRQVGRLLALLIAEIAASHTRASIRAVGRFILFHSSYALQIV